MEVSYLFFFKKRKKTKLLIFRLDFNSTATHTQGVSKKHEAKIRQRRD